MERITPRQFRRLSPEKQEAVRRGVMNGEIILEPDSLPPSSQLGPSANFPDDLEDPGLLDSRRVNPIIEILAALHPDTLRAVLEWIRTLAEKRAARLVAIGNLDQARLLARLLETINGDPTLSRLVLLQIRKYLPEGVDLNNLPPDQQIEYLTRGLADFTSMPKRIETYERERGASAKEPARLQAMIAQAEDLKLIIDELPKATKTLRIINERLRGYLPQRQEFTRLSGLEQMSRAAEKTLVFTLKLAGLVGGLTGGLTAGLLALPVYAGQALGGLAERAYLPVAGGLIGIAIYASTHLGDEVFTPEYAIGALTSLVIGALGLPAVIGVVKGAITSSKRD